MEPLLQKRASGGLLCMVVGHFALFLHIGAGFAVSQGGMPSGASRQLTTSEIARRNAPAVVTISSGSSAGSGVIVDSSGVIATALHIVRGEREAIIKLPNGDTYSDVTVIDVDDRKDIVLLKVKAFGLPSVTLGNSDRVSVGDRVVLIGSPRGLDSTVSDGLVSAVRDSGDGYRLIQTDAAASPGSSGGPMFSQSGELVGIVNSKLSTGENLNFAVPINYFRGLLGGQARMTLGELAVRYPTAGPAQPSASSQTAAAGADEAKKQAHVQGLVEASQIKFSKVRDGLWSVAYKGEHLSTVTVTVRPYENLIIAESTISKSPKLTETTLKDILKMSYTADLAKPALLDDGTLVAVHELESVSATGAVIKSVVIAVANLADDIAGVLSAPNTEVRAELAVPGFAGAVVPVLGGRATLNYRAPDWKIEPAEQESGVKRTQWRHRSSEVWVLITEERGRLPQSQLPDIAFALIKDQDPSAKVLVRGSRVVNGKSLQFQEFSAKLNGIDVVLYGHYYSDDSGTIQITGWTLPNLLVEHRRTIDGFVAGFQVKD